jgi:hypothetical protein
MKKPALMLLVALALGVAYAQTRDTTVNVEWTDNCHPDPDPEKNCQETHFNLERCTGPACTDFKHVEKYPADTQKGTHTIKGDPGATSYSFRLNAENDKGASGWSNVEMHTTAPLPPPPNIEIEAESGTLTPPMASVPDGTASGGQYVVVPEGTGSSYDDAKFGGPGEVSFTITVATDATYTVWARILAPDGQSDSFYVVKDGAPWHLWHVPGNRSWQWNRLSTTALQAGTVTLAFRQREDGTRLDRIILSTDLNFVPGGTPITPGNVRASIKK